MRPANPLHVKTALARVNTWCAEGRAVKVAVSQDLQLNDSGWGGAQTDCDTLLRLVYRRDSDSQEVDVTIDVSDSVAVGSTIWSATPEQQAKFGHFDETLSFAFSDGRQILLMCAGSEKHADN
jgi:hypothetical protein